jgi:hypothetical protein
MITEIWEGGQIPWEIRTANRGGSQKRTGAPPVEINF